MKISVICASRLQPNPYGSGENLYLDTALMSAKRQVVPDGVELELVVALDAGAGPLPARFDGAVTVAYSDGRGQARALNAGVAASTGDVVAIVEDDDIWVAGKLGVQLELMSKYGFASCNQREITEDGAFVRYNDFATPSGWIMPRSTWNTVGPFDETFRWHIDNEWLGRLNWSGIKRAHVIHDTGVGRQWVQNVRRFSAVMKAEGHDEPFVNRRVNPDGGMETIRRGGEAAVQSVDEYRRIAETNGGAIPW